jgi:NAD-dependent deacetylase
MDDLVKRAADLVVTAAPVVVFTGAGASTESGIPDFRSPTGLWARHDPDDFSYQRFVGTEEGRRRYWAVGRELYATVRAAQPNAAHHAIAELDALGLLDCVITQNIDNLHQRAGVPAERVIELHGNATRARCLTCERPYDRGEIQDWLEAGVTVPGCAPPCGGVIKPRTVMFGEAMPREETEEAERRARASDLFIVVGSSLVVYPAAHMPVHAKRAGARLVIVNRTPTPQDDEADLLIADSAAAVLSSVAALVADRQAVT